MNIRQRMPRPAKKMVKPNKIPTTGPIKPRSYPYRSYRNPLIVVGLPPGTAICTKDQKYLDTCEGPCTEVHNTIYNVKALQTAMT